MTIGCANLFALQFQFGQRKFGGPRRIHAVDRHRKSQGACRGKAPSKHSAVASLVLRLTRRKMTVTDAGQLLARLGNKNRRAMSVTGIYGFSTK
jgi:hypothetical protein